MDPRDTNEHPDRGQYAYATAAGDWTVVTTVVGLTHAFDIAETIDGLWLFGSDETQFQFPPAPAAIIYRSVDNGATWTESLNVPGSDAARFYAAAQFGDTLIAYLDDDPTEAAYRWDAGSTEWTQIATPPQITDTPASFTLNGTPFCIGFQTAKNAAFVTPNLITLITLDEDSGQRTAITESLPSNALRDATVAGGYLWLLTVGRDVLRGDTAGNWTAILTLDDDTVRSIAVDADGGFLYFGTTDSRILRTPIPA